MAWFDDLKTPRIKTQTTQRTSNVPEGLWLKCPICNEILQNRVLEEKLKVCTECHHHFRMSAAERISMLSDLETLSGARRKKEGTAAAAGPTTRPIFEEYGENIVSNDPLRFQDTKPYRVRLRDAAQNTGIGDACVVGRAQIFGIPYHLGVFEFKFMGGSMGVVVGEKLVLLFERALSERLPVVILSSSGGARMQEGILSLMQMAKTCAAVQLLRKKRIPFVSVLTDPTTGGVAASFAMLGDIILAEPGALIGFAGPRVIQQTIRQSLPPGFQKSEFLLSHGFVDRIVPRQELKKEIYEWIVRLGGHTCDFPQNEKNLTVDA